MKWLVVMDGHVISMVFSLFRHQGPSRIDSGRDWMTGGLFAEMLAASPTSRTKYGNAVVADMRERTAHNAHRPKAFGRCVWQA